MSETSVITERTLRIGQTSPTVNIDTSALETLTLQFSSTKIGSDSCQARMLVLDDNGSVMQSVLINDSDQKTVVLAPIPQSVSVFVECLLGATLVEVSQLSGAEATGTEIELDDLPVIDSAHIGAGEVLSANIGAGEVKTANLDAGAGTLPKLDLSDFKTISAVGADADPTPADIIVAGPVAGDRLVMVFGAPTLGGALVAYTPGVDFEAEIAVTGKINQLQGDLSLSTLIFLLAPAAA